MKNWFDRLRKLYSRSVLFQGLLFNICLLDRRHEPAHSSRLDESSSKPQHSEHLSGTKLDLRRGNFRTVPFDLDLKLHSLKPTTRIVTVYYTFNAISPEEHICIRLSTSQPSTSVVWWKKINKKMGQTLICSPYRGAHRRTSLEFACAWRIKKQGARPSLTSPGS